MGLWLRIQRAVKYFDFPIQTMALGIAALSMICYKDGGVLLLVVYLGMGLWQMFSATLFLIARAPFYHARIAHFILSVLCLAYFRNAIGSESLFMALILAGLLALFYYTITVLWTFKKPQTRGFLRHISF